MTKAKEKSPGLHQVSSGKRHRTGRLHVANDKSSGRWTIMCHTYDRELAEEYSRIVAQIRKREPHLSDLEAMFIVGKPYAGAGDNGSVPGDPGIPQGHERPEPRCWVSKDIVREIDPSELTGLADDSTGTSSMEPAFRFLADRVCSLGGALYVRDRLSGRWRIRKKGEVNAYLYQNWLGAKTEFNITRDTISQFFDEARYPILDQTIYVPGAGRFLWFQSERCLNTWFEPPMRYDPASLDSEEFALFLKLINENLLGQGSRSTEQIMREIDGVAKSPLRFFMHWLASLVQRPGCHLPTTLWLVGKKQGIGKGVFTTAMKAILGPSNVKLVNDREWKGEWNDFIGGNQLLIGDELKMDSQRDYDSMKRCVSNPIIALRKRNLGQFEVPNVANWIFTANEVLPGIIGPEDRRNVFISTSKTESSIIIADQFYRLSEAAKRRAYEGLAALLATIQIDGALISRAIWTPKKGALIGAGLDETQPHRAAAADKHRARFGTKLRRVA